MNQKKLGKAEAKLKQKKEKRSEMDGRPALPKSENGYGIDFELLVFVHVIKFVEGQHYISILNECQAKWRAQ